MWSLDSKPGPCTWDTSSLPLGYILSLAFPLWVVPGRMAYHLSERERTRQNQLHTSLKSKRLHHLVDQSPKTHRPLGDIHPNDSPVGLRVKNKDLTLIHHFLFPFHFSMHFPGVLALWRSSSWPLPSHPPAHFSFIGWNVDKITMTKYLTEVA